MHPDRQGLFEPAPAALLARQPSLVLLAGSAPAGSGNGSRQWGTALLLACSHKFWWLSLQTAMRGRRLHVQTALLLQGQVAAPAGGNDGANRGRVHSYIIDESSGVPNRQAGQMGRLASTTTICEVRFMGQRNSACSSSGAVLMFLAPHSLWCCQGHSAQGSGLQAGQVRRPAQHHDNLPGVALGLGKRIGSQLATGHSGSAICRG